MRPVVDCARYCGRSEKLWRIGVETVMRDVFASIASEISYT